MKTTNNIPTKLPACFEKLGWDKTYALFLRYSCIELAERYPISHHWAAKVARHLFKIPKKRSGLPERKRLWFREDWDRAKALRDSGMTYAAIDRKLGWCKNWAQTFLKRPCPPSRKESKLIEQRKLSLIVEQPAWDVSLEDAAAATRPENWK